MSALAGIVYWNGQNAELRETEGLFQKMGAGRQAEKNWREGPAAFAGAGIFEDPGSGTVTVFYGRLDDARENLSGAEIMTQEYKKNGPACFRGLTGDFSAVIWDKKNRRLILVRDPLGIKPLYYLSTPSYFLFASEAQALLGRPGYPLKPNDSMTVQYLTGEFFDPGATFYDSVRQVPPAHAAIVEAGKGPRLEQYWQFQEQNLSAFRDRQDYLDRFYFLFKQSVRCRLKSTAPVGVLLSGGLDSTQITAMAETLRREEPSLPEIKNVCLLVEGFLEEEKKSIDSLQKRYASSIDLIRHGTQESPLSTFELFMETGDTPHLDGYLTTPLLLERLRSQGCGSVLSGFGANEIINPFEFGYLEDALLSFRWKLLYSEIQRFAKAVHCRPWELFQGILTQAAIDCAPDFMRSALRLFRRGKSGWLRENYKKLWRLKPAPRPKVFKDLGRRKTWRALTEPLAGYGFAQMDQMGRKYSMEVLFPFLDLRLVEFFLSVPAGLKMEGGYRKNFAQSALAKIVPMPVRKEDDEACFIPSLKLQERINLEISRLQNHLFQPEAPLYQYVHRSSIERMIHDALSTRKVNLPFLWRLARLNAWLQNCRVPAQKPAPKPLFFR